MPYTTHVPSVTQPTTCNLPTNCNELQRTNPY
uniref:Uncharacterized protein n=1 Tax=Siphoviridae sp. ctLfk13 TaxID=2826251 RepID=A0A8S5N173_9CAUD|nr:MAG TPA: hypothetical protein [Siphoviridae sp. ctLfk13]